MSRAVPVTFLPSRVTAWVDAGTTVLDASRRVGVGIDASCGGRGTCGKCGVRVIEGSLSPVEPQERAVAGSREYVRLACRARIAGPVTVRPVVAGDAAVVPARTADGVGRPLVAGVDLGTTNVSAAVVEPESGVELGRATVPNAQRSWGGDVVSRVTAALEDSAGALRDAAVSSVASALAAAAGDSLSRVTRLVIAGNTTMSALITGADVTPLASAPFSTVRPRSATWPGDLTGSLAEGVTIEVVAPIASFVGGDVLAGLVGLGIEQAPAGTLMVDIGTNAEVTLWDGDRITVASAPAGPAFEGAGITSGGPAVSGAVTAVQIDNGGVLRLETIGCAPARWFCGAGLVSALGALRASGHLEPSGSLRADGPLAARFARDEDDVLGVDLGEVPGSLVITQLDVRTLQLAKAAVRVAIEGVLRETALKAVDLAEVRVAGAFGGALDAADLVALGMLPSGVADRVVSVGNAALTGAVALAIEPELVAVSRCLADTARSVELVSAPGFGDSLIAALAFDVADT